MSCQACGKPLIVDGKEIKIAGGYHWDCIITE